MSSGVYFVLNEVSGRFYIGSSKNVRSRWSTHRYYLRRGDHWNQHLQNAYNLRGPGKFSIHILEEVEQPQLLEREQFWIDTACPAYNKSRVVGPPIVHISSEEARRRVRVGWESGAYDQRPPAITTTERAVALNASKWTPEARAKHSQAIKRLHAEGRYK